MPQPSKPTLIFFIYATPLSFLKLFGIFGIDDFSFWLLSLGCWICGRG
jgi:hypothetical protein